MTKGYFSRRSLLRTALGSTLLVPLLGQRRLSAEPAEAQRLILVSTPNAFPESFWPSVADSAVGFALSSSMQAFAGLEEQLLFVRELHHTMSFGDHHAAGMGQMFTGARVQTESPFYALGPSLDQVLTGAVGQTPWPSIHLGVGVDSSTPAISYVDSELPVPTQTSPAQAYRDIFGFESGTDEAELDVRRQVREQMIGLSLEQLAGLQNFLGQDERLKLEQHMDSLRQLQAGIFPPVGQGCSLPELVDPPSDVDPVATGIEEDVGAIRSHLELIRAALQCDVTRIATLQLYGPGTALPPIDAAVAEQFAVENWHDAAVGGEATAPLYDEFHRFFAGFVAELARALNESTDVFGNNLLENTLIIWSTECGTGHNHGPEDVPYLLIGGRGLGIDSGKVLQNSESEPVQRLFTAVLEAFGQQAQGFGELADASPLPGIVV